MRTAPVLNRCPNCGARAMIADTEGERLLALRCGNCPYEWRAPK